MSYSIDRLLDPLSMYRLVTICLSILFINAFILALLGVLDFTPLTLVASAIILIGMTYLSSRLFGLLFGIRIHGESSIISALILFFVFTPSLEIRDLMTLGLIGMIASLSKYILTFRGRHIFNPVAIAAVIIGFTGLAYASWWVATPVLLPVTLVSALLILYKTRRFALGLTFLVVAIPLVLIVLFSYGTPVSQAPVLLMSWPFLFFVGFMLTEPLTLPPKKWQQIIEAVIVGFLFAVPLQIGSFALTMPVALIIGNIFAFIFSKRSALELVFTERRRLTPTTDEFIFSLERKPTFQAGQYMEITIPHKHKDGRGLRRSFSLVSAPGETTVKFGVKFYSPSSTFKKALKNLQPGTTIFGTTIGGDFTLPKNTNQPLLFVAGGIGITPFISHLLYLHKTKQSRDIVLLYVVSNVNEIAYIDILQRAAIKVFVITKTDLALPVKDWTLLNISSISKELLNKAVPDITTRTTYISGPPSLVSNTKKHLKKLKVKQIKTDYFTGY